MERPVSPLQRQLISFFLVGCVNCAVGFIVMLAAYNLLDLGYWLSSALNYICSSIVSFHLNRRFTFKSSAQCWRTKLRFAGNIVACYILAYSIARPLITLLFSGWPAALADNIAMISGMILFSVFNYFGQSRFVFGSRDLVSAV